MVRKKQGIGCLHLEYALCRLETGNMGEGSFRGLAGAINTSIIENLKDPNKIAEALAKLINGVLADKKK